MMTLIANFTETGRAALRTGRRRLGRDSRARVTREEIADLLATEPANDFIGIALAARNKH